MTTERICRHYVDWRRVVKVDTGIHIICVMCCRTIGLITDKTEGRIKTDAEWRDEVEHQ